MLSLKSLTAKKKYLLLLLLIGIIIRYLRMWGEFWWLDEQLYLGVGMLPFKKIVLVQHWLVDHPQVYIILSHLLSRISTNLIWLRLPNLIFFGLGFYYLNKIAYYLFEERFGYRYALLLFFALHPVFVGIDSQAIPYSLAIALFLASSYYLLTILFARVIMRMEVAWFLLSMVLWAYTSFEFIYWFMAVSMYLVVLLSNKCLRKRIGAVFGTMIVAGLLFLPEVRLVLGRMNEMKKLSNQHIIANVFQRVGKALVGYWEAIGWGWEVVLMGLFLTVILVVIEKLLRGKKSVEMEKGGMYFWFVVVVTMIMITGVNYLVYPVGREKTFYMVNIGMGVVFLQWWGMIKPKMRVGGTVVLISWFVYMFIVNPGGGHTWLKANQQRMGSNYNPIEVRKIITDYAKSDEREVVVYVDRGKDFRNIPVAEYYLKCLDLNKLECPEFKVISREQFVERKTTIIIMKDGKINIRGSN